MELILVGLFILQLIVLFFVSRLSITRLFQVLRLIFDHEKIVYSLIAFIFFPGTVIHELSHFVMAVILLLKVRDIHVFPQWEGRYLKLGSVYYEKKDVVRSVLVGIAPVIVGLLLFWWLFSLQIFESSNIFLKITVGWLVFILSTTMFSSKQDLIDIVYLIPVAIVAAGIIYIFQIDFSRVVQWDMLLEATSAFVYAINIYLLISLGIHALILFLLQTVLMISKKI
ncbi:hypothetical protein IPM65_00870 [Candidatus Roizmanbacteria bacterium]|nr:MAG: hypothetical protein IPM65_00870 [Candidatus Roizmanbacteria bacterium]